MIGSNPFAGGECLSEITIPDDLEWLTFEEGFLVKDGNTLVGYFKPGSTVAIVPDEVTCIGYAAFRNCASLEEIMLREGVTEIESFAFQDCISL